MKTKKSTVIKDLPSVEVRVFICESEGQNDHQGSRVTPVRTALMVALFIIAPTLCQAGLGNDSSWMNGALPAAPATPPSSSSGGGNGSNVSNGSSATFGYGHWYNPPAASTSAPSGGGGGGYSAPAYYNPGPSQAQIAAQMAAQQAAQQAVQREAEHQQRLRTARSKNLEGLASFKRRDWASAAVYFKQALDYCPGDKTLRSNLAQAELQLADQRRENERKVADSAAASDMKAAINQITHSVQDTNPKQQTPVSGLSFISTGDSTRDSLGGKKSNPTLEDRPTEPLKIGTDIKAMDQLVSIAHSDRNLQIGTNEDSSANAQLGVDAILKKGGNLSEVNVAAPASERELPKITPAMAKDRFIKEDLEHFNAWNPQFQKAKEEVKQAQAAVDNAKDNGAKAVANTALIAAKAKSDGLEIAVESAKADIADRKIHIEKFAVSGEVPGAAPAPSVPPVATN